MHRKLYFASKYLAADSFPDERSPTIPKIRVNNAIKRILKKLKQIYNI